MRGLIGADAKRRVRKEGFVIAWCGRDTGPWER